MQQESRRSDPKISTRAVTEPMVVGVPHPPVTYEAAVDELYAVPREEFVAHRTELAKAARAAGDRALASRIGKLAKPTTAAWLANRLARTGPDDVRALAELGVALRQAHERLDGAEIRSLIHQRAELIGELMTRAEDYEGEAVGEAVTRDLADILTTATSDAAVAGALVAGRLSSVKAYASAPEWPPAGASTPKLVRPKTTAGRPIKVEKTTKAAPKAERSARERVEHAERREAAERTLKAARADVKKAETDRAATERSLRRAEVASEAATSDVERLETELKAAEMRERQAQAAVTSARRSVREATDRAARAWRQVQAAEAKLRSLAGD